MNKNISDELLAAYAEGQVTPEERQQVRQYLAENPREFQSVLMMMDCDYELVPNGGCGTMSPPESTDVQLDLLLDEVDTDRFLEPSSDVLPMTAMAARNSVDNLCVIRCEGITLRHFGMDISDEALLQESEREGWLQPEGTALHNIGRLCGVRGLSVSHRYHCTMEEIEYALMTDQVVIAVVNGSELADDYQVWQTKGQECLTPNHVVIVTGASDDEVRIIDSATPEQEGSCTLTRFLDAWSDSSNALVIINDKDEYIPHPINLEDVEVEEELIELREAIAENAHEVWAESRRAEGWTYGPVRDDAKKQNPDMLPYNRLPESEKEYDRLMAMNTIKLVKKLGWELTKKK